MIRGLRTAVKAAPTRHRDLYIEVKGARLRYRDEGGGPAVALVHGWTLDLEMWAPQAAALSAAYRVIRFDRRGFGLSSGQPSLVRDVADLQAICLTLDLRRVALVGMSQGARVTLQLTGISPAMVSCLVLDGPSSIDTAQVASDPQELPYQDFRMLAQTRGVPAFRKAWMEHPLARLRTDDPHVHELLARMIARYPGRDLLDRDRPPALATTPQMIETVAYTSALRQFLDRHATSPNHH
jgi:pimeloyl-ACP methyl ester carboxylesterase